MMNLTMSVLLLIANANQKVPKEVTFAELKKLAYETVKAKEYPKALRPTYKLEKGTLSPSIPGEPFIKPKDGSDADMEVLRQLIRVAKFDTYPPKDMGAKLKAMTVAKAEKRIKEGVDQIRDKKLTGKSLADNLTELEKSVNEILYDGVGAYAKVLKVKVGGTYTTPQPIPVKTNPKDGTVHCITQYDKRLFELKGMNPETEVMRFVISDEVPYVGWVYYVVTWDEGRKKVGPREMEIKGEKVTFE